MECGKYRTLTSFKTNALHSLINTPLIDRNAWVCSSPDLSYLCPGGALLLLGEAPLRYVPVVEGVPTVLSS